MHREASTLNRMLLIFYNCALTAANIQCYIITTERLATRKKYCTHHQARTLGEYARRY